MKFEKTFLSVIGSNSEFSIETRCLRAWPLEYFYFEISYSFGPLVPFNTGLKGVCGKGANVLIYIVTYIRARAPKQFLNSYPKWCGMNIFSSGV